MFDSQNPARGPRTLGASVSSRVWLTQGGDEGRGPANAGRLRWLAAEKARKAKRRSLASGANLRRAVTAVLHDYRNWAGMLTAVLRASRSWPGAVTAILHACRAWPGKLTAGLHDSRSRPVTLHAVAARFTQPSRHASRSRSTLHAVPKRRLREASLRLPALFLVHAVFGAEGPDGNCGKHGPTA